LHSSHNCAHECHRHRLAISAAVSAAVSAAIAAAPPLTDPHLLAVYAQQQGNNKAGPDETWGGLERSPLNNHGNTQQRSFQTIHNDPNENSAQHPKKLAGAK